MRIVRLHPVTTRDRVSYPVPAVAVEWIQGMEVENDMQGNFFCTIVYTAKGHHRVSETPEEIESLLNSEQSSTLSPHALLSFAHWLQDNPFPVGKSLASHVDRYIKSKYLGGS